MPTPAEISGGVKPAISAVAVGGAEARADTVCTSLEGCWPVCGLVDALREEDNPAGGSGGACGTGKRVDTMPADVGARISPDPAGFDGRGPGALPTGFCGEVGPAAATGGLFVASCELLIADLHIARKLDAPRTARLEEPKALEASGAWFSIFSMIGVK
jgi:hypothetical protein